MKKIIIIVLCILSSSFFISCEKEVELDLNTAKPRLVINAPLKWYKGTTGNHQTINLTLSAGYYDTTTTKVTGAQIRVTNSTGETFIFNEVSTQGVYECFDFVPVLFENYNLTIVYENETYQGSEILYPVVDFDSTLQSNDGGISGNDIQVKAFFTDPANTLNYYLTERKLSIMNLPSYSAFNDQLFNGNQVFDFVIDEDLKSGDRVDFELLSISKTHQEYCTKVFNSMVGGPFQTITGKIKGNMINTTNPSNYPLGYFSVSQVSIISHTIN